MSELSPDVKKLLSGAEALFDALKRAKPTQALAVAIRDDVKFSKLQDPEIFVMCMFYKEIGKLAQAPESTGGESSETNGAGIKPDAIEPPPSKAADKKPPKNKPDPTA